MHSLIKHDSLYNPSIHFSANPQWIQKWGSMDGWGGGFKGCREGGLRDVGGWFKGCRGGECLGM